MAQSDLIVMIFEHRQDALHARNALELMRGHHHFGLDHVAEIVRDTSGQLTLQRRVELSAHLRDQRKHLPALLCYALFGQPNEEQCRRLSEAGLDEFFVNSVAQALVPDSSALLIFVPHDNTAVDTVALLNAMTLLKGALHRTSVPRDFEIVLLHNMHAA